MSPVAYRPSVAATFVSPSGAFNAKLPAALVNVPSRLPSSRLCRPPLPTFAAPPIVLIRPSCDDTSEPAPVCAASTLIASPAVSGAIATRPSSASTRGAAPRMFSRSVCRLIWLNSTSVAARAEGAGAGLGPTGRALVANAPPCTSPNRRLPLCATPSTVMAGAVSAMVLAPMLVAVWAPPAATRSTTVNVPPVVSVTLPPA